MLRDTPDTWDAPDVAVRLGVNSPRTPEGMCSSSHVLVSDAVDQAMLPE